MSVALELEGLREALGKIDHHAAQLRVLLPPAGVSREAICAAFKVPPPGSARARVAQKRRDTLSALSLPDLMHDHAHRLLEDIEDAHALAALAVAEARADGFVIGLSAGRHAYTAELDCLRRLFLAVGSDRRLSGFDEAGR